MILSGYFLLGSFFSFCKKFLPAQALSAWQPIESTLAYLRNPPIWGMSVSPFNFALLSTALEEPNPSQVFFCIYHGDYLLPWSRFFYFQLFSLHLQKNINYRGNILGVLSLCLPSKTKKKKPKNKFFFCSFFLFFCVCRFFFATSKMHVYYIPHFCFAQFCCLF